MQPVLAKNTRVCAYDRAGWGLSQTVPGPQDANDIADELHGLLDAAGIDGSVVLMGHSTAGMYISGVCEPVSGSGSRVDFCGCIDAPAG